MSFVKLQTKEEKLALDFWGEYYKSIHTTDVVDKFETPEQKEERIKRLEADPPEWMKHYFAKYCTAAFMYFHLDFINEAVNNPERYLANPWSRELSKSGVTFLVMMYLHLTGKKKFTLMISANKDAAIRLLRPYKLAFEKNPRIINDYGNQVNYGQWAEDEFCTRSGSMFIAVGAGQAPRGARNEEIRPDSLVIDDFDTDEDCRNPDIIQKKWEWFEQAVYGTRSISNPLLVIWNGNIIADDCCMKRALKYSDHYEIVNIRDKDGKSTWPDKNTEEFIDRVLEKISAASAQKEYFNNPVVLGKVFKKLNYGKTLPLNKYKFLVGYTDPSYKKSGDFKALAVLGKYKDEYHVLFVRCRKTTTSEMIDWQFDALKFVNDKTALYLYIEWPWIDDTIKREIKKANKRHNKTLNLKADERTKPDKFYRVESNLEPLNTNGKLIFDEELRDTPDMKEFEFQFLALSPKSRANDDAPDCVEGGVFIINHKSLGVTAPPKIIQKQKSNKRY